MNIVTMHLPADPTIDITLVNYEPGDALPLHTDQMHFEQTRLAIYANHDGSIMNTNVRANVLIEATTKSCEAPIGGPCTCEDLELTGDLYVVCVEELAQKLMQYDIDSRVERQAVIDFREWLEEYVTDLDIPLPVAIRGIRDYLSDLQSRAEETAMKSMLAEKLGITPENIGVIHL